MLKQKIREIAHLWSFVKLEFKKTASKRIEYYPDQLFCFFPYSSQKRSNALPSLEVITHSTRTESNTGEKFKSMLEQLDRMILDKTEEMEV